MDDIKRRQFDSCSYDELNDCILARIKWIREFNKFLNDSNTKEYTHTRATLRLNILISKQEIHRIWKIRHLMKRYNIKNWDHEFVVPI
jgi:hypothetical protein